MTEATPAETATLEKRSGIAWITIHRPHAMNAIDPPTHARFWEIWAEFDNDDALQVAIVTGEGDEAFCAGADLKAFIPPLAGASPLMPRDKVRDGFCGITRGQHRIYKPILAAVNGWALAGGLELALACDIRIASENAKFGSFEVRRGYHHGDGGIARLVNVCGVGLAMEMLLTGEPIDAQRALAAGLVSRVVPRGDLLKEAERVAVQIMRNDPWAVRSAKQTILDVIGRPARRPALDRLHQRLLGSRQPSGPRAAARLLREEGPRTGRQEQDGAVARESHPSAGESARRIPQPSASAWRWTSIRTTSATLRKRSFGAFNPKSRMSRSKDVRPSAESSVTRASTWARMGTERPCHWTSPSI